jgi:hypothetical protein
MGFKWDQPMFQRNFQSAGLIDRCSVSLNWLFGGERERAAFASRFRKFVECDESLEGIARLSGDVLRYESESFLPVTLDASKPSLFFVMGNPAPDSVARGAMYAYEGTSSRQHRFWKVLHTTGVLRFSEAMPDVYSPQEKMDRLFAGEYESPFNVHVIPFFSLASPAGGAWSGVNGLRRLLGQGFARVTDAERAALGGLLQDRARKGDRILVFQKDAYLALKEPGAPGYDGARLRGGAIEGRYGSTGIDLICLPPTRLFYSHVTSSVLEGLTHGPVGPEKGGSLP